MSSVGYGDYADKFAATASIFLGLTTISILLRFYVRGYMIRAFGADDWLLLACYLVYVPLAVQLLLGGIYEKQIPDVLEGLPKLGTVIMVGEQLYLVSQILLKQALAAFFLRIVVAPWQRWTLKVSVTIFTLYELAYMFVYLFKCGRPSWQTLFFPANCPLTASIMLPLDYISAALNCITDWIMVISPVFIVATMQLSPKARLSICFLTLLGLAASVVSIVRIPLIGTLEDAASTDYANAIAAVSLCSVIESGIGITALALAALRPLLVFCVDRVYGITAADRDTTFGFTDKSVQVVDAGRRQGEGRGEECLMQIEKSRYVDVVMASSDGGPAYNGDAFDYRYWNDEESRGAIGLEP